MSISTESVPGAAKTVEPSLHRVMGPWLLLLFIVGDILGTGIYALTGQVAKQVGGVVWMPFVVAFAVAVVTAFSYLELVTKYPRAAGAALYTHRAFGIHFITFIVAFAVMCSGITSASTASRAFAANLSNAFDLGLAGTIGVTLVGLAFMALVAIINFRGVGESVKANVVLTCVELTGLLIIIVIGLWAIGAGEGDVSRVTQFNASADRGAFWSVIAATTLAFFAMVGFEDSVNMVEECKEPRSIFPKVLLTGLLITGLIYVLVSISAVTLVAPEQLGEGETPLLQGGAGRRARLPAGDLRPHHHVRRRQQRAHQHADGEPPGLWHEPRARPAGDLRQGACRRGARPISRSASPPCSPSASSPSSARFPRSAAPRRCCCSASSRWSTSRSWRCAGTRSSTNHFRTPTFLPVVGALACAFLAGPWTGRDPVQYKIAGILIGIGVVLWVVTVLINRATGQVAAEPLTGEADMRGPVN